MTTPKPIEKPMLFSAPMVRAILEGRKTQTRRVVKPQPDSECSFELGWYNPALTDKHGELYPGPDTFGISDNIDGDWSIKCPHPVGSRIWVRETWQTWTELDNVAPKDLSIDCGNVAHPDVNYTANGNIWDARIRPSIHMPRWASRITLEVTDVRVQRLQDISEEDARAEGVERYQNGMYRDYCGSGDMPVEFARTSFSTLWESIYGPDAWEQNPWVWAYTFKRVEVDYDHA